MFNRLIIPLDGSRLSEAVLPTAVFLAEKLHASITLVHVIERNAPTQKHGEPHLTEPAEADAYLEDVRRRMFPDDLTVEMHVHTTAIADVAQSIVEHAREFESDLVMMCTHGRSGLPKLRKVFFGSIAQQISATKIPVLLVHPVEGSAAPIPSGKPFLIPLDGTETREQALPIAAALAQACGANLRLLLNVPSLDTLSGAENSSRILLPATTSELLANAVEDGKKYLARLITPLLKQGLDVKAKICQGNAAELIIKETQSQPVDMIVMGTSARTPMDAFWSGSVSPKISNRTHLPLLLIPEKA